MHVSFYFLHFLLFLVDGEKVAYFFLDPAVGVCECAVINRNQFYVTKTSVVLIIQISACWRSIWYQTLDGFENGNANVHCLDKQISLCVFSVAFCSVMQHTHAHTHTFL